MHILFCLDYYYPHIGGAEILFQNLAEGLVRAGHKVQIVTQMVSGAEKHQFHNGVEIFRVNTFGSRYLFPFAAIPVLLRLAKNADLIHTSTFAAALPAWLAARLRGKKILLTVHEVWIGKWSAVSDAGWLSNAINAIAERLIYVPRYDGYIAVSNATARALQGFAKSPIEVIYNAVDYEHWNPVRYDGKAVRRSLGLDDGFLFCSMAGLAVPRVCLSCLGHLPSLVSRMPGCWCWQAEARHVRRAMTKLCNLWMNLV